MAMDAFSASLIADKREIVFAPTMYKFQTFAQMAEEVKLGERDVVLTNEFIYTPFMKELGLKCSFVFQEKFGAGEPSEAMIQTMYDAIPYDSYDRVIAVGGGGIPVIREGSKLSGTPAVIDKDFGSALLAELLDADLLIILTAVEKVAINYNKPDQKGLDDLTPAEAYKYMEENQFAKGSMLPKVQAAVKFAESKAGRTALITLLEKAKDGIEGKTGTRIHQ